MKLVSVGECTVDRYLDLGIERVGGISLNFAVNARRCGAKHVALVTATGTDAGAALVREKLAREQIDATRVRALPGPTASQAIRMAAEGERLFPPGGYQAGVLADLRLDAADLAFIRGFDIVAAPFFRQVEHLFRAVIEGRAQHTRCVADFLDGADCGPALAGLDAYLDTLSIAFVSGGEELAELLLPRSRATPTLIVVTHGAAGSSALVRGERLFQAAEPAPEPVDTTGCGDAFQAAFTVAYFGGAGVPAALAAGSAQAARVLRHYGATGDL